MERQQRSQINHLTPNQLFSSYFLREYCSCYYNILLCVAKGAQSSNKSTKKQRRLVVRLLVTYFYCVTVPALASVPALSISFSLAKSSNKSTKKQRRLVVRLLVPYFYCVIDVIQNTRSQLFFKCLLHKLIISFCTYNYVSFYI